MTFARKTAALVLSASLGAGSLGIAALGTATPAIAQPATEFNPQSLVGNWLYDANGTLIGSVYGVTDGGRTVIVQWGSYLTPGRHLIAVPSADFASIGGRTMLRTLTAEALASRPAVN